MVKGLAESGAEPFTEDPPSEVPVVPACQENPILYRAAREAGKVALWQRIALRLAYPALLVGPTALIFASYRAPMGRVTLTLALTSGFAMSAFLALALFTLRALEGTVAAFTRERELRTLEGLLTSRLSPRDLLVGKLAACLRPLLADWVIGLPFWALFVVRGAATLGQVLTMQGLLVVYTLFAAVLGMWCSLRERSSMASGRLALGILGGVVLAGPVVDFLLGTARVTGGLIAFATSPPMVVLVTIYPNVAQAASFWSHQASVIVGIAGASVVLCLVATANLYGRCLTRLKGLQADLPVQVPRTERSVVAPVPRTDRSLLAPAYQTERSPLARFLAEAWDNPVWFRHFLWGSAGGPNLGWLLQKSLVPAILLVSAVLASHSPGDPSRATRGAFELSAYGIAFLFGMRALSAGARAVADERERRTLDPLLGTRTGPRDLLLGLLAVVVGLPALEFLAWSPVLALFDGVDGQILGLLGFTLAFILLCGTLGLWLSCAERTAQQSLRKAYSLVVLLWVGSFLLDHLLNDALGYRDLVLFSRFDPIVGLGSALTTSPYGARDLWIWCAAAYVGAAAVFVWATERRLARGGSQ